MAETEAADHFAARGAEVVADSVEEEALVGAEVHSAEEAGFVAEIVAGEEVHSEEEASQVVVAFQVEVAALSDYWLLFVPALTVSLQLSLICAVIITVTFVLKALTGSKLNGQSDSLSDSAVLILSVRTVS